MNAKRRLKLPQPKARDDRKEVVELFGRLKEKLPAMEKLLAACNDHWGCEDGVYRFYHQSWKVYDLQDLTSQIVEGLKSLRPSSPLNAWFLNVVQEGTGKTFSMKDNDRGRQPQGGARRHAACRSHIALTAEVEYEHES